MTELRIKQIIRAKGMTQQQLADKLGIGRVNLNTMINGKPTLTTLERLASTLGVEVWEFFVTAEEVRAKSVDAGAFVCPCCGAPLKIVADKPLSESPLSESKNAKCQHAK